MKRDPCIVCPAFNEELMTPHWLKYHLQWFQPIDVYLLDDRSTDKTRELFHAAGCNIIDVPVENSMRTNVGKHGQFVSTQFRELLEVHSCAVLMEADDFLMARDGDVAVELQNFVASGRDYLTTRHLLIVHDFENEPTLDESKAWLTQRTHALTIPKFHNPCVWSVPPRWKRGYHNVEDGSSFGLKPKPCEELWALDLHSVDLSLAERRHAARSDTDSTAINKSVGDDLKEFFRGRLNGQLYAGSTVTEIPNWMISSGL